MKRPEILAAASSMEELLQIIRAGADAVTIGEQRWGMRLPGDFDLAAIQEAVRAAREHQVKIYVSVTNFMDNNSIKDLPEYIGALSQCGVDAIVFGDPAVLMVCRQIDAKLAMHWNAEMTSTNYATANFWAARGASRAVLARELNMDQIVEFKRNALVEVQVQVHGMTNIYHSRRRLVESYLEHQTGVSIHSDYGKNRGLYLVEAERKELKHPIYEDYTGTHIMSADDICMLDNLPELIDSGIDSFKIEGLLKSADYNETAVRAYREAVDAYLASPSDYVQDPEWLESIQRLQDPGRELSYGFFYKEQVY